MAANERCREDVACDGYFTRYSLQFVWSAETGTEGPSQIAVALVAGGSYSFLPAWNAPGMSLFATRLLAPRNDSYLAVPLSGAVGPADR